MHSAEGRVGSASRPQPVTLDIDDEQVLEETIRAGALKIEAVIWARPRLVAGVAANGKVPNGKPGTGEIEHIAVGIGSKGDDNSTICAFDHEVCLVDIEYCRGGHVIIDDDLRPRGCSIDRRLERRILGDVEDRVVVVGALVLDREGGELWLVRIKRLLDEEVEGTILRANVELEARVGAEGHRLGDEGRPGRVGVDVSIVRRGGGGGGGPRARGP